MQQINLDCHNQCHQWESQKVDYFCIEQNCVEGRLFCHNCFQISKHNLHHNKVEQISKFYKFIERNRLEITQILNTIEEFQQSVMKSFNDLRNGIYEKYKITDYRIGKLNQEQVTQLLESYLDIPKLQEYVKQKIELNIKSLESVLQNGIQQLDLNQLSYNRIENDEIQKSNKLYEEGNQLFRLNQYDRALEKVNESVQINPKNVQALYTQVEYLKRMEKIQEAKEIENKVKQIVGQNSLKIQGQSLMEMGEYSKALLYYENLVQINPNDIQPIIKKAECLKNLNKGQEALANYEKVLQINQNHIEAIYGKTLTLIQLNKYQEASRVCDKLTNHDSNNLKFQLAKAICLMNLYKIEEALDLFEIILEIDENNMMALIGRGRCLNWFEKKQEADDSFNQVLQLNDSSPLIMFYQGESLRLTHKNKEALEMYDKILQIKHFNHLDTLNGLCLLQTHEQNKAIECFEQALNMDSQSLFSLYGIATCLYKQKEYSQAVKYYDRALLTYPEHIPSLVGKHDSLVKLEQHQLAKKQQYLVLQIYNNAVAG